jgi:hypothetical protein
LRREEAEAVTEEDVAVVFEVVGEVGDVEDSVVAVAECIIRTIKSDSVASMDGSCIINAHDECFEATSDTMRLERNTPIRLAPL